MWYFGATNENPGNIGLSTEVIKGHQILIPKRTIFAIRK